MSLAAKLQKEIETVIPVYGVAIGDVDDKSTWRVDYKEEPTDEIKKDVQVIIDSFDTTEEVKESEIELLKKQVNELTKLLQTSKDIAEINTEAAKLEPLPEKIIENLKNGGTEVSK